MNFRSNNLLIINVAIFLLILFAVGAVGWLFMSGPGHEAAAQEEEEDEEDKEPPTIFNVLTQETTPTSTVISWQTDEEADSLVNFGLDKRYGIIRDPRADKTNHSIIIEDLISDQTYYYRITSSDVFGNQGISSNFTFKTLPEEKEPEVEVTCLETILDEGKGGLSETGVEQILQAIDNITSEEIIEKIQEKIEQKAEEIITPPTIILDTADIEIGVDYAIIYWQTDKESNSVVAIASEADYVEGADDPYRWKVAEPDELVLEHKIEVVGLTPASTYHFRVSSESAIGLTGYSKDRTFKTKSVLPEIFNLQIAKVEEESATIKFMTNVPCSSIIEYTNLNTNSTKLEGNSSYVTVHSIKLSNLIFDTYYSVMIKVESEDKESAVSDILTFITTRDKFAPVISKVNTESTIYPGSDNKIQTIASWETDEPSMCQLFYHQGLVSIDEPGNLPKEEDMAVKHVNVITNFLPSSVYKFWIICEDEAKNIARSDDFTMLTPTQEESIIDIIIKNFESSFGWVKKMGK